MKNTVNADLKRGTANNDNNAIIKATTGKTVQLVGEAERKFKEEHTFHPQINKDFQVPITKEESKQERWKKLTEPKTTEI